MKTIKEVWEIVKGFTLYAWYWLKKLVQGICS